MDVFFIEDDKLIKHITVFGIESAIVLEKKLIGNTSTIKKF